MLNVGTIGTSWITEQFIQALKLTRRYHIKGIYSRNAKNARDIAKFYQADYYCDQLNNLLYETLAIFLNLMYNLNGCIFVNFMLLKLHNMLLRGIISRYN